MKAPHTQVASPNSFQLQIAGVGELLYQLESSERGLVCTRSLRRGPCEMTRMVSIFTSPDALDDFVSHDEYRAGNERFFERVKLAGQRFLR